MANPVVVTLRRLTYEEEQRLALDMMLCRIRPSKETSEERAEAMRAERKEQQRNKPVVL